MGPETRGTRLKATQVGTGHEDFSSVSGARVWAQPGVGPSIGVAPTGPISFSLRVFVRVPWFSSVLPDDVGWTDGPWDPDQRNGTIGIFGIVTHRRGVTLDTPSKGEVSVSSRRTSPFVIPTTDTGYVYVQGAQGVLHHF